MAATCPQVKPGGCPNVQGKGLQVPCDELDIIEAYGGEGPGHPNAFDAYMICPHAWNQGEAGKALEKKAFEGLHNPIRMRQFGIPSAWFEKFHTYGCKITESDTIYYCDNIEVGRHPTLPLSKQLPIFFLINLATGGGCLPPSIALIPETSCSRASTRVSSVADMMVAFAFLASFVYTSSRLSLMPSCPCRIEKSPSKRKTGS